MSDIRSALCTLALLLQEDLEALAVPVLTLTGLTLGKVHNLSATGASGHLGVAKGRLLEEEGGLVLLSGEVSDCSI